MLTNAGGLLSVFCRFAGLFLLRDLAFNRSDCSLDGLALHVSESRAVRCSVTQADPSRVGPG